MEHRWRIEHRRGTAQELHDRSVSEPIDGRAVVVQEVVAPALVLGSTQSGDGLDHGARSAAGVGLARRRSGGGAVLLHPGDHVWIDLVVPAGDALWEPDVMRATWWVGDAWRIALGLDDRCEVDGAVVHRGAVVDRVAARAACFAAVGPGEIVVGGRKVLGVSQRRTRAGARFQCLAYRSWDPEPLVSMLGRSLSDAGASALRRRVASAVGPGWSVVEDLVPSLP